MRTNAGAAADDVPALLLVLINKGERADLSQAERNDLRKELQGFADDYRSSVNARIAELKKGRRRLASLESGYFVPPKRHAASREVRRKLPLIAFTFPPISTCSRFANSSDCRKPSFRLVSVFRPGRCVIGSRAAVCRTGRPAFC